eukprot:6481829-Amphidinium_carterae.1
MRLLTGETFFDYLVIVAADYRSIRNHDLRLQLSQTFLVEFLTLQHVLQEVKQQMRGQQWQLAMKDIWPLVTIVLMRDIACERIIESNAVGSQHPESQGHAR